MEGVLNCELIIPSALFLYLTNPWGTHLCVHFDRSYILTAQKLFITCICRCFSDIVWWMKINDSKKVVWSFAFFESQSESFWSPVSPIKNFIGQYKHYLKCRFWFKNWKTLSIDDLTRRLPAEYFKCINQKISKTWLPVFSWVYDLFSIIVVNRKYKKVLSTSLIIWCVLLWIYSLVILKW